MCGEEGADRFVFQDTAFGRDRIKDFAFGVDVLDMGALARSLALAGENPTVVDGLPVGVVFAVDRANVAIVENATLADVRDGDVVVTDPFA